jgi:iron(III) transport system permease protein
VLTPARPRGLARPPLALWFPALALALLCLLPPVYLLLRAAEAPAAAFDAVAARATFDLLARSLALAAVTTLLALTLALPLAWLTTRTDLPGRRPLGLLVALPLAIPSYVAALVAVSALGPRGLLQQALAGLGVERLPSIYGFWGTAAVLALATYPYILLTLRPALLGLDPRLDELSRGFGYGRLHTLRRVTLPQLRPALASGSLLVALYTLADFGAPSLLRFDSFTRVIFVRYQTSFERTEAAALALLLGALALALVALELATRGHTRYDSAHGPRRAAPPYRLGRWRWPACAAVLAVLALALALPLGVLAYWLVRGLDTHQAAAGLLPALRGSLLAASCAALAAAAAALPVARIATRYPRFRLARPIELGSYAGAALPGLVVALALVFAAIRIGPLYQTLALLVLAYVLLYLPQAVGATRVALLQVGPALEEAARGLGRRPLTVLRTVSAPLAARGVLAGAALVFLSALKELPATLLLAPAGFDTLAVRVWSASAEALYARAALPALLLVALSALPVAASQLGRRRGR